jgi:hypothetical protein
MLSLKSFFLFAFGCFFYPVFCFLNWIKFFRDNRPEHRTEKIAFLAYGIWGLVAIIGIIVAFFLPETAKFCLLVFFLALYIFGSVYYPRCFSIE